MYILNLTTYEFGNVLGDFFTKTSGNPFSSDLGANFVPTLQFVPMYSQGANFAPRHQQS
jgi:hypothetical protein